MQNGFYNMDCMEGMAQFPDNHFDLAIVDPPYSDETNSLDRLLQNMTGKKAKAGANRTDVLRGAPDFQYWDMLFRKSKNQIIWGVNWYNRVFGVGRIVWDKQNEKSNFSDCEIAYQSINRKTTKFVFRWNGMLQGNMTNKEIRIHPTQKPVALYKWLLENYAKPGDLILDTHVGSASSLIACEALGYKYVGFELDEEYFTAAQKRLVDWRSMPLFENTQNNHQLDLAI